MLGKTPKSAENPAAGRDSAGISFPAKASSRCGPLRDPSFNFLFLEAYTVTWRMKGVSAVVLALVVVALVSRG